MLREAVRLQWREEARMAGFLFKLETADGKPADPPQFSAAVPNWGPATRFTSVTERSA